MPSADAYTLDAAGGATPQQHDAAGQRFDAHAGHFATPNKEDLRAAGGADTYAWTEARLLHNPQTFRPHWPFPGNGSVFQASTGGGFGSVFQASTGGGFFAGVQQGLRVVFGIGAGTSGEAGEASGVAALAPSVLIAVWRTFWVAVLVLVGWAEKNDSIG